MNSYEGMGEANATSSQALSHVIVAFCLGCCDSVFHPNWIRHFKITLLILKTQPAMILPRICVSVAGRQAANFYIWPNIQVKCRDFLS